jgi:DNA-binding transcriptional LysR family regulator
MYTTMMKKWTEVQTAYQVAKLGTVSAAAQALGCHRATINRHIDTLEEELGARVFIRHARGYALTELGKAVLRTAEKTEELMNDLAGRATFEKVKIEGEIKITTIGLFYPLFRKAIVDFRMNNPSCSVLVSASEDLARLDHGEAHIALRAGVKPEHPDYVVQTYRKLYFNLYAHESYVQKFGLPSGINELSKHKFIAPRISSRPKFMREWISNYVKSEQIAFCSDEVIINTDAILSGIGIGFLNDSDIEGRSDLHAILPPNDAWVATIWLVTHVDLHRTAKVQTMLNYLKKSS